MAITIEPIDPRGPATAALLAQSHAMMQDLFDEDDCHFMDIEALCGPDIRFFRAQDGDITLGCGALALRDGYGEVKSMFTDPAARGRGVADMLLDRIEEEARSNALPYLRLETGDLLKAAVRLYERHGFRKRGPFGSYPDSEASLYMEKAL